MDGAGHIANPNGAPMADFDFAYGADAKLPASAAASTPATSPMDSPTKMPLAGQCPLHGNLAMPAATHQTATEISGSMFTTAVLHACHTRLILMAGPVDSHTVEGPPPSKRKRLGAGPSSWAEQSHTEALDSDGEEVASALQAIGAPPSRSPLAQLDYQLPPQAPAPLELTPVPVRNCGASPSTMGASPLRGAVWEEVVEGIDASCDQEDYYVAVYNAQPTDPEE